MNLFVTGINHKTAPIAVREKFFLTEIQQELLLSELKSRPEVVEAFVLSTCNRTEIYLNLLPETSAPRFVVPLLQSLKKIPDESDLQKHFYAYQGSRAVEHLLKVASGLDSLVLGEKQILGQVKTAFEQARQKAMLAKPFNTLSQVTIRAGKKARSETEIGYGGSSVSWAAINLVRRTLGTLSEKRVLVIGAGKMSELALQQIKNCGVQKIYIMNRSQDNAKALGERYDCEYIPFCDIKDILTQVDVCVCSSGAPHYVLEKSTLEKVMFARKGRPLVLVDISMPRNIDPRTAEIKDVMLFHIDDLEKVVDANMKRRQEAIRQVEAIVATKLNEFYRKLQKQEEDRSSHYFEPAQHIDRS